MSSASLDASRLLWNAWQQGQALAHLPQAQRPLTRAQGYAVQAALAAHGRQGVAGWKIAATSVAGQRHIGVSGPLAGRLLGERVHLEGTPLSMAGNRMAVAEPEFAFRMGQTLAPRASAYTQDEVMAAVAALHLAIEVPNSRFVDFVQAGEAQLIADNACAHEFILGRQVPDADWRLLDLAAHKVFAEVLGTQRSYQREGLGANVLGDPRIALTWLANELSALGVALEAGQVVTTGTCVAPLEIVVGDVVRADFGVLGTVQATFTA